MSTTRYRYPRPADYEAIVAKAKAQQKGIVRFIKARTTWTLIDGRTGVDRKDWAVKSPRSFSIKGRVDPGPFAV